MLTRVAALVSKIELASGIIQGKEQAHDPSKFSLGWSWSDVRVSPATLNNLILKGLVEEKFHSNSYRGLLLTELGHEQAKEQVKPVHVLLGWAPGSGQVPVYLGHRAVLR